MVALRTLFAQLRGQLLAQGFEDADFEAAQLLRIAGAGDIRSAERVYVQADAIERAQQLLQRRLRHEPLQYLAGEWDFLDFTVYVGPGVLIPRQDTELCAQLAIQAARSFARPRVVDLCSGTGVLALAVARACADAQVTAVEYSEKAMEYLKRNHLRYGGILNLVRADVMQWNQSLAQQQFDVIVSNPPYVTEQEYQRLAPELYFEPKMALTAADNGLAFYRHMISAYRSALAPAGCLIVEIGESQAEAVMQLFEQNGYCKIELHHDCEQRARVVMAQKPLEV